MKKRITKKLSSFTIDKKVIEKFDDLVFNNEKSLTVETMMREFIQKHPTPAPSLKYHTLLFPPEKRGVSRY